MNAITYLIQEHNKIRSSLSAIKALRNYTTKKRKFNTLCQFLIRHETMEQKAWYPHFKNERGFKTEVNHLIHEEKSAAHAIKAIKKVTQVETEEEWEKQFAKFKKAVEHHAKEEETKLFPHVAEIFDNKELEVIGKKMRKFKATLKDKKI